MAIQDSLGNNIQFQGTQQEFMQAMLKSLNSPVNTPSRDSIEMQKIMDKFADSVQANIASNAEIVQTIKKLPKDIKNAIDGQNAEIRKLVDVIKREHQSRGSRKGLVGEPARKGSAGLEKSLNALAKRGLEKGSIYTHDIHIVAELKHTNKILSNMAKVIGASKAIRNFGQDIKKSFSESRKIRGITSTVRSNSSNTSSQKKNGSIGINDFVSVKELQNQIEKSLHLDKMTSKQIADEIFSKKDMENALHKQVLPVIKNFTAYNGRAFDMSDRQLTDTLRSAYSQFSKVSTNSSEQVELYLENTSKLLSNMRHLDVRHKQILGDAIHNFNQYQDESEQSVKSASDLVVALHRVNKEMERYNNRVDKIETSITNTVHNLQTIAKVALTQLSAGLTIGQSAQNVIPAGIDFSKKLANRQLQISGIYNDINGTAATILERESQLNDALEIRRKTGVSIVHFEKQYLALQNRGIKNTSFARKITVSSLRTARLLDLDVDNTADTFGEWTTHLQLTDRQMGNIADSVRDASRLSGIMGDHLLGAVKSSKSILQNMKDAGNFTNAAAEGAIKLTTSAQKFGVSDVVGKMLGSLSNPTEALVNPSAMTPFLMQMIADAKLTDKFNSGEALTSGQDLKAINEAMKSLRDSLRGMNSQAANSILLSLGGPKGRGELDRLIQATEESQKTFGDRLGDIDKQLKETAERLAKGNLQNATKLALQEKQSTLRIQKSDIALEKSIEDLRSGSGKSMSINQMAEVMAARAQNAGLSFDKAAAARNIEAAGKGKVGAERNESMADAVRDLKNDLDSQLRQNVTGADTVEGHLQDIEARLTALMNGTGHWSSQVTTLLGLSAGALSTIVTTTYAIAGLMASGRLMKGFGSILNKRGFSFGPKVGGAVAGSLASFRGNPAGGAAMTRPGIFGRTKGLLGRRGVRLGGKAALAAGALYLGYKGYQSVFGGGQEPGMTPDMPYDQGFDPAEAKMGYTEAMLGGLDKNFMSKQLPMIAAETTLKLVKRPLLKAAGVSATKVIAKKIPLIGAAVGVGLGVQRLMNGDPLGAFGEALSGVASIIPIFGTAASVAIDGLLLMRDANKSTVADMDAAASDRRKTLNANQIILDSNISTSKKDLEDFNSLVKNAKSYSVLPGNKITQFNDLSKVSTVDQFLQDKYTSEQIVGIMKRYNTYTKEVGDILIDGVDLNQHQLDILVSAMEKTDAAVQKSKGDIENTFFRRKGAVKGYAGHNYNDAVFKAAQGRSASIDALSKSHDSSIPFFGNYHVGLKEVIASTGLKRSQIASMLGVARVDDNMDFYPYLGILKDKLNQKAASIENDIRSGKNYGINSIGFEEFKHTDHASRLSQMRGGASVTQKDFELWKKLQSDQRMIRENNFNGGDISLQRDLLKSRELSTGVLLPQFQDMAKPMPIDNSLSSLIQNQAAVTPDAIDESMGDGINEVASNTNISNEKLDEMVGLLQSMLQAMQQPTTSPQNVAQNIPNFSRMPSSGNIPGFSVGEAKRNSKFPTNMVG